jgi:two-component system sensor histidine kinase KdpD
MGIANLASQARIENNWVVNIVKVVGIIKEKFSILASYCLPLLGVAPLTWLAFFLGLNLASSGYLYLVLVVLVAMRSGFWQATITSITAVICLDYFFTPPVFKFSVSDTKNWVALGAFEFTALIISRLSHLAQLMAVKAKTKQRDSERLYQTSRQILLLDRFGELGQLITALIRDIFELRGVVLFDAASGNIYSSGNNSPAIEERVRSAYFQNSDELDRESNTWFCVLRLGAQPIGSMALCNCEMTPLAATALASLSAITLERTRSLEKECRAEAARQSEQLRAAVLDALAHELKTPLTTIWTASSGLLMAGGLSEGQTELVNLIDKQSKKLNDLASRLLGAAKLDSKDFKPQSEPVRFSSLIAPLIQNFDDRCRKRFRISVPVEEPPVLADRKLIATAIAQLIDNALKYSIEDSPIEISVSENEMEVIWSVRNQGLVIATEDYDHIFERFYRAASSKNRPVGTGLGLSIVKRIVDAHKGCIWFESKEYDGTKFSLSLPKAVN